MFKPEDACWYNPARREFMHSWGVWSVWHFITRLHQHNPCHSQDMELSFTPEKLTLTVSIRNRTDNNLSVHFTGILSYETVVLMKLWLCHSTWCLWDNSSFLLLLEHASHCGAIARRAVMTLMDRFHFLRWAPGLDYAAVFKLKSVRGCQSSCTIPRPSTWCCQIFPAGRSQVSHHCTTCVSLMVAFCDLLPIFLLDYLFSYCWIWVSLWTKVLCWVSVLQVLSPHLWLLIHLLNRALHRVQVFNSGEV